MIDLTFHKAVILSLAGTIIGTFIAHRVRRRGWRQWPWFLGGWISVFIGGLLVAVPLMTAAYGIAVWRDGRHKEARHKTQHGTSMTRSELRQRLRLENVPEDCYSLEGGLPAERYCLGKTKAGWEVYYSERGTKSDLKQFTSEHEACEYFYERLKGMLRYS